MCHGPAARTRVPRAWAKPSRQELLPQDGQPVLCIMLGTADGRWRAEFASGTRAAMEARRLLCHAVGVIDLSEPVCVSVAALGISVLQSWHFVHDAASHEHTWAMLEVVKAAHSRRKRYQVC